MFLLTGALLFVTGDEGGISFGPAQPPSRFYFEARIEVAGHEPPPVDIVRSWYEAPDRWRWEYASSRAPDKVDSLQVSDGGSLWTYSARTNTFQVQSLTEGLRQSGGGLVSASFILGPMRAESVEAFFGSPPFESYREVRRERYLGRPVQVVEADTGTARSTFWVDVQRLFVLRYVQAPGPSGVGGIEAQVTTVRYDEAIREEVFRFEPPAGATQATR
jgi:outer membrane lipoprotein-sorting protein